MTLTKLYWLIVMTKISLGLMIIMILLSIVLFACLFIVSPEGEKDKRMISIGFCFLAMLSLINCFIPSEKELVEILGGSYYTNGPATKNMEPAVDKAVHEFLIEYDKSTPNRR